MTKELELLVIEFLNDIVCPKRGSEAESWVLSDIVREADRLIDKIENNG